MSRADHAQRLSLEHVTKALLGHGQDIYATDKPKRQVSAPTVAWLSKSLPFWDDSRAAFEAHLRDRQGQVKRGRR
jgi:hypothetical protein